MSKQAMIIFVRKPELGKVKTRLAVDIGNEAALFIYQKLLQHTAAVTQAIPVDSFVFYAGEIVENDEWLAKNTYKRLQKEADLGKRMRHAFEDVFEEGYSSVVIIGSDCPQLTEKHLASAFSALEIYDVVLGPASDGGYYLLGMKTLHNDLFNDIPWSTSAVLEKTLDVITANCLTVTLLETLTDVDEEKDLPEEWKRKIKQGPFGTK